MIRKIIQVLFTLLFVINATSAQDFYDVMRVREVKLRFAQTNWDVLLDSLKQTGTDDRLLGELTIDGVKYDSIGVRYKGNSSYHNVRNQESSKLPFNIKADFKKKKQTFPGGYTSLKLSNSFRDPSFLREVLAYEIAGKYMPSPRACFVKLYINDVLIGLYNSTESVDEKFLMDHFGYDKGTLVKCDPTWDATPDKKCPAGEMASLMYQGEDPNCYQSNYELKSEEGWKDLIHLTKVLNEKPKEVGKILNVDQVLWMHAFNNVLVNLDSYTGRLCHNYYLYLDSFDVFHPLLWDMNLAFGAFRHDGTGSPLTDQQMIELSPFIHYKSPNRPLISQLLADNLQRKIYLAHMGTIIKDHFANGSLKSRATQLQQLIDVHVQQDKNKLYTYEAFKANLQSTQVADKENIIGIMELMDARLKYLQAHPLLSKAPPAISMVQHQVNDTQTHKVTARVENGEEVWLFYRQKDKAPFQQIAMTDDGQKGDSNAGDKVYSITLELHKGATYYIVAENEKTAALLPERASFEFYTIR